MQEGLGQYDVLWYVDISILRAYYIASIHDINAMQKAGVASLAIFYLTEDKEGPTRGCSHSC